MNATISLVRPSNGEPLTKQKSEGGLSHYIRVFVLLRAMKVEMAALQI